MSDTAQAAQPSTTAQQPATSAQPDPKLQSVAATATGASAGASPNAVKEAAAAAEAKRRLKIDNQEVDEDEVIKVYKERKGHQQAANKELQAGKTLRKQAEEFIGMMKDPKAFYEAAKKLGHDPRKLAEEYLAAQLEEELMDPREKELKETKTKLQKYEELEKQQKEAAAKRRDDELKAKFAEDYTKQFTEALKETSLPPTKAMVAEMAKYIHRAAKMNFQMTAKEAAQLVKEDIEKAHRNLYGEADAETLVRLLGEAGVQKLRSYDVQKLKDPAANLKTPEEQAETRTRARSGGQRMTPAEWREFNRKKP